MTPRRRRVGRFVGVRRVSAGGDERPGHATRRPVIAGVLVPRGTRRDGRRRNAGRRRPWPSPHFCTRNRTDPISGFANNGDAPVFYLDKTGYPWRYLPKDFPPYKLVNYYYTKWTDNRWLEKVNTVLRQRLRQKKDRKPGPTGAIIDSQSVKGTPESYVEPGCDGGQLVTGRKTSCRCRYNRLRARHPGTRRQ